MNTNQNENGRNRRILVIDDNASIHADFQKILCSSGFDLGDLDKAEAALFGDDASQKTIRHTFELASALQGQEGLKLVQKSVEEGRRFAMAFVDVRMPPGWDGIETTARLWEADPDLQIVICTAYSDYSWDEMLARFGTSDRLVILKKPFDSIEVQQLTNALTEKWNLLQESKSRFHDLEKSIGERTCDLQSVNEQLRKEVHEHQLTEQALRATQDKLGHFLGRSPAVLYSFRFEGKKIVPAWITDNYTQFTGGKVGDWYARSPTLEHVDRQDRVAVCEALEVLLSRGQSSLEYRIVNMDGHPRWVRDECKLLRDAAGQPVEIIGCWTDIGEKRQLEDQLRQAQKMESVGQLAGGVAHDFNNLLMVILGHVEMLLKNQISPESRVESLERIQGAADRASNLTRQLLAFSRKQVMRPEALDLNELVRPMIDLLRCTMGEHIKIKLRMVCDTAKIFADRGMIEQVIMNLAVNARDAMPHGGELLIGTELCVLDKDRKTAQTESRPGQFVCFSVKDFGCGIPENLLPNIFEPFFTTKDVGKGTGLGLATVYGNIKQHNGWVEAESVFGSGTTFKVFLPIIESPAKAGSSIPNRATDAPVGGKETILVVEDESALRILIKTALKRLGYNVLTASSGTEAIKEWSSRLEEIDLLMTDIVMPDRVSGWDLAKEFRVIKPSLPVIYMSGYNAEMTRGMPLMGVDTEFLQKPFAVQLLARRVRSKLDAVLVGTAFVEDTAGETLLL